MGYVSNITSINTAKAYLQCNCAAGAGVHCQVCQASIDVQLEHAVPLLRAPDTVRSLACCGMQVLQHCCAGVHEPPISCQPSLDAAGVMVVSYATSSYAAVCKCW
jgi:hypothetical protein